MFRDDIRTIDKIDNFYCMSLTTMERPKALEWIDANMSKPPLKPGEIPDRLRHSIRVPVRVIHVNDKDKSYYTFGKFMYRDEGGAWFIEGFQGQGYQVTHWQFIIDPVTGQVVC